MKKSTLITTIAMIVVVVVALSTATYAWFSSQATAVASTNFTTNASGDWSMMVGTVADTDLTFNGTAVDSATLTRTAIQAGLWAPTAVINTTISSTEATTSLANKAAFVSAEKSGSTYTISRLQTANYNSGLAPATPTAGDGLVAPFALRVMNVSGQEKTLQLNITLNAKQTGTTNSMYAAAAVRFYVYEIRENGETDSAATYTLGYTPIASTLTETVNGYESIQGTITPGTAVDMTTGLSGTKLVSNVPTPQAVVAANYNVANIADQFTQAQSANENLGIAQNDYVKTYTFDMQTYGVGGFSNIIIYAWIDGWIANGSAASADFDINFGFTSVPTAPAQQGSGS